VKLGFLTRQSVLLAVNIGYRESTESAPGIPPICGQEDRRYSLGVGQDAGAPQLAPMQTNWRILRPSTGAAHCATIK
jgi:hypothetical protein